MRDKGAWEIERVTFTGNVCYPFHVIGVNHYERERGEAGSISWAVPSISDNPDYDLSGATFEGATSLR